MVEAPHISNGAFLAWVSQLVQWLHRRIDVKQQYPRLYSPFKWRETEVHKVRKTSEAVLNHFLN